MSIFSSMRYWALVNKGQAQAPQASQQTGGGGWWSWVNSVAGGLAHFIGGQFVQFAGGVYSSIGGIVEAFHQMQHVVARIEIAIFHWVVVFLKRYTDKRIRQVQLQIKLTARLIYGYIKAQVSILRLWVRGRIAIEASARHKADVKLDHEIKTRIKWLHQQIEREAVSAYRAQRGTQDAVITKLLDLVINLNPVLRPIVSDIIKGILDLAVIDDPVARLALGFAMREVINRLGLDKPIGDLLHGLLGSIIGQGKPKDLHAVILDMCSRLAAGEQQWTQFYADGGSEVEQAGEQWQAITKWTTDAALLGMFGLMATEPAAFARDVTNVMADVVHGTVNAVHGLIRGA